ncbi:hypothetical protein LPN01_07545 [Sphingomonas sp. A2-49]|uniref:hypothetical protein n=1 Tax=Sphingomonas sp. A2-49 TaxID=1391375 RepID=UPI0021D29155|nr:hypothetical protein [Sphingomonas sp. A2-49]MCU6453928.1 hypothetical protein [Sphingomonas sp. A2-49]
MTPHKSISAASIVIRRPTVAPREGLRRLIENCGSSKHDCAIVFITAAIESGVNTGPAIIALGGELGLNRKHVAIILHGEAGENAELHRWRRGNDGTYALWS